MALVSKKRAQQITNPVVGAKIEISSNGKICHQCRQRRMDLAVSCVTLKGSKACPNKYCTKCLLNRYGEKAEEVVLLNDWICPKCRGNCNCSYCMKKRGQKPTGILVHTAKATGFSSVSELLEMNGPENFFYKKKVKPEAVGVSPQKLEQEMSEKDVNVKKPKKSNREGINEINNGSINKKAAVEESSKKRIKISDSVHETDVTKKALTERRKNKGAKDIKGNKTAVAGKITRIKPKLKGKEESPFEVQLPRGTNSITVSGIELPPEDAGNALQFLEFCSAFGKALDLRKGQAECVMRELLSGRSNRRQQYSTLTQMIIQLLSVILEDKGENSAGLSATDASWFAAVGECLSESEVQLENFPPELFNKGIAGYEKLDRSKRLKLLNFLCDETLCTSALRKCIESHNLESIERKKEAKEKIAAAKEKEKQLKQKLQDEVAKAVMDKNGVPLTIAERDAIVLRIKAEAKEADTEMSEAIKMLSKKIQGGDDAVRTNLVELDENGLIFWRLKFYDNEQNILVQDIGTWGEVRPHEKWLAFSTEQKPEIEKYISLIRMKRLQTQKN